MENLGIYIHIPFCKKKCKYCDFISFSCCEQYEENYIEALLTEIDKREVSDKYVISTIYIGGGTPSLISSKNIKRILDKIYDKFRIDSYPEITIEVNPGTATKEKLEDYKNSGINRVSIGLQSTQNRLLELIGRIHNFEDFLNTYNLAKEVGFENINVDLMLAIPTQTEDELLESVQKVINLNPNHISIYSLILEEGTELENLVKTRQLEVIEENVERTMYWKTKELLEKNEYSHYEISNFAKDGKESKHNLACWNQEEYLGFGLAAHSYYQNKRFSNIDCLEQYMKNIYNLRKESYLIDLENNKYEGLIELYEIQDKASQMKEFMMLGLRKIEGVKISDFERKFKINPLFYFRFEISVLTDEDLIEVDLNNIKLTNKGLDFANLVFEKFI